MRVTAAMCDVELLLLEIISYTVAEKQQYYYRL